MREGNLMVQTSLDAKIERLQKELKETKAAKVVAARKERNGQLIGFGVLMEQLYKSSTPDQRENLRKKAIDLLDDRNKTRALEGFDRLDTTQGEAGE